MYDRLDRAQIACTQATVQPADAFFLQDLPNAVDAVLVSSSGVRYCGQLIELQPRLDDPYRIRQRRRCYSRSDSCLRVNDSPVALENTGTKRLEVAVYPKFHRRSGDYTCEARPEAAKEATPALLVLDGCDDLNIFADVSKRRSAEVGWLPGIPAWMTHSTSGVTRQTVEVRL